MGVPRRSALGRLQRAVVGRLLRWPTARLLLPDDPGHDGAVRAYRARFARAPLVPGVPLVVLRRGGP